MRGTALTAAFSENLDTGSVPAPGSFHVSVDGTRRKVSSVAVNGATVTLTLAKGVILNDTVKLRYAKPATGPLQDLVGNDVANFGDQAVTNRTTKVFTYSVRCSYGDSIASGFWFINDMSAGVGAGFGDRLIPCDMAKPAWIRHERTGNPIWVYDDYPGLASRTNPPPPRNEPVEEVRYRVPDQPNHRVVVGTDHNCYREELVRGQWRRSNSYGDGVVGSDTVACRNASWNAYYRAQGGSMIDPVGGVFSDHPAGMFPDDPKGTFPDDPAPVYSVLEFAAVNEKTLTLHFDQTLKASPPPPPWTFRVTVNGAGRSVASGGVAIEGATVTLTLAAAVTDTDMVKVSYTKPSTHPLRDFAGFTVQSFAERDVVNETREATLWETTLVVQDVGGPYLGCHDDTSGRCTWTPSTFRYKGVTYTVNGIIAFNPLTNNFPSLTLWTDKQGPFTEDWKLYVDDVLYDGWYASEHSLCCAVSWAAGPTWSVGQRVTLRLAERVLPPPELQRAVVHESDLTLIFDQDLNDSKPPTEDEFHVTVNGERKEVIEGTVFMHWGTPRHVVLWLDSDYITHEDTVRVRYTRPPSTTWDSPNGPLESRLGDAVESFDVQVETPPETPGGRPELESAVVSGKWLTLTFDLELDPDLVPWVEQFQVEVNSSGFDGHLVRGGITLSEDAPKKVKLELVRPVRKGETVEVEYTVPNISRLRSKNGVAVWGFTSDVTNQTP